MMSVGDDKITMKTGLTIKSLWLVVWLLWADVSSSKDLEHLGCFKDYHSPRTMPKYLGAIRLPTPQQIIQKCAEIIQKKGYLVFGIQNRHECWSSPDAEDNYNKHGPSNICTPQGIGGAWANDVYKIKLCRQLMIDSDAVENNKILSNHSIAEHLVMKDGDICRIQCFLNPECVSYNLGPSTTPELLLCELNNADRYQHRKDYQDKPGFKYVGTKNLCNPNPCTDVATCKRGFSDGFRCVCPLEFNGEHCRK